MFVGETWCSSLDCTVKTFALLGTRPAGNDLSDDMVVFAVSSAGYTLSSGCLRVTGQENAAER